MVPIPCAGWRRSDALRELILAEIWRLLESEPDVSRALDARVQVRHVPSSWPRWSFQEHRLLLSTL